MAMLWSCQAMPIRGLRRPAVITQRPSGMSRFSPPALVSIPRQPPLTPLYPDVFGRTDPASNVSLGWDCAAVREQRLAAIAKTRNNITTTIRLTTPDVNPDFQR